MSRPVTPLRDRKRTKVRRGWCRKNLHRMVGANVECRNRVKRCRACMRETQRARRKQAAEAGVWRREKCMVYGCHSYTDRFAETPFGLFACRKHREQVAA